MKKRTMKLLVCLTVLVLAGTVFAVPAFAAGDVATAIEQTWKAAQTHSPSRMDALSPRTRLRQAKPALSALRRWKRKAESSAAAMVTSSHAMGSPQVGEAVP